MAVGYGEENKYAKYGQPTLDLVFTGPKESVTDRVGNVGLEFTRSSTATYVGSDGLIKSAAVNEARFDHDKDGNGLGLLIEESRTNVATRSQEFTNSAWFKTGMTATDNVAVAPDGTTTAATLMDNGTDNIHHGLYQAQASRTRFTQSFFVKPNGNNYVNLRASSTTLDWHTITFALIGDGSVTQSLAGSNSPYTDVIGTIIALANGWYRISMSGARSAGNAYVLNLDAATGATETLTSNYGLQATYTSDTSKGYYIWGGQLEEEVFLTSYIPTTSSTVTRSADVASLTNSSIYDIDRFTILNEPFGSAAGASTLSLVGAGETPIKRTTVYSQNLTQTQINASVGKTDEFWRWRILGSSFGLPNFTTDGQVTVDWGDGTVETLTTSDHTFTDGGGYHEIGFRLDSGTYFRPYINNNASHDTKVVAVGPAPESMQLNGDRAFYGCTNLEAFDATVDASGGTSFSIAWAACSSLTSFPLIDTSSGTIFTSAWNGCSSITSFPLIDTSSGTIFNTAWRDCSSLTSFPLIDTSSGTSYRDSWRDCSGLTSFPANFFDSWTGTPVNDCFLNTWDGCTSLSATSVENILNSIDTSGRSAPASGVDITIDYNASSGTPSISTAVTNLKSRGWTITLNGVAQ